MEEEGAREHSAEPIQARASKMSFETSLFIENARLLRNEYSFSQF